mgnify:CR=1 FL=1|jgi:hypothetical protein
MDIKSYCIDFNWENSGTFARPGLWAKANPSDHVQWYKTMGANVIQTFCVSCNGYAWYNSDVVPPQPGLEHDFLRDVVRQGHQEGMKVMGYFCISANSRWGKENPALSYGSPSAYHIPYTDLYLEYLAQAITDAVKTTGIDGFMIDWVWMPNRKANAGLWIESEKILYEQLMGQVFPGEKNLSPQQDMTYSRAAIERTWKTIHKAAKAANPDCLLWLTTNQVEHPHVFNSQMYRDVEWLMGEQGKLNEIEELKISLGTNSQFITCMSDFGHSDATVEVPNAIEAGIGLYGYAKPTEETGLIPLDNILSSDLSQLSGNEQRIAVMARAYRGKSLSSIWKDGDFFET